MASRAHNFPNQCTIVTMTVETAATVAVGQVVKDGNADGECQPVAAKTDLPIGVVVSIGGNTAVTAGAAGDKVQVALLNGGVVPVKLGGTATRGQSAIYGGTAGQAADAVPSDTTPVFAWAYGYFLQSGVQNDLVGLALCRHTITE
jgi:hypothetical protein